uniref:GIY-YIG endonuclease n=1 Tax=Scytalidium sp. TaxID=1715249 RepID=A0A513U0R5_9PEZI|nr:GIY-YIG endonuclease [Scytalidium sp.]
MSKVLTIILPRVPSHFIIWSVRHSLIKREISSFYVLKTSFLYRNLSRRPLSTNVNKESRLPNNIEKSYYDPVNQRELIRIDNNGKIGVYAWENKINNKLYVGSGDPLYVRISDYYQPWYLESRNNLYIVRSLNKYSMNNFNLHILEYSNSENLIMCEQKWIDIINPEYNLNPIAGSSKGYKHSPESIEKNEYIINR